MQKLNYEFVLTHLRIFHYLIQFDYKLPRTPQALGKLGINVPNSLVTWKVLYAHPQKKNCIIQHGR